MEPDWAADVVTQLKQIAAWLEHAQRKQTEIDPSRTTLEVTPNNVEQIIRALQAASECIEILMTRDRRHNLENLISGITEENRHAEIE
jgi:hypothetical protein